jgi:hypothetical protein
MAYIKKAVKNEKTIFIINCLEAAGWLIKGALHKNPGS